MSRNGDARDASRSPAVEAHSPAGQVLACEGACAGSTGVQGARDADRCPSAHGAALDRPGESTEPVADEERLLTPDEVAHWLGVRRQWVYDSVRAGDLGHVRLGRYMRFQRTEIRRFVRAQEVAGRRR